MPVAPEILRRVRSLPASDLVLGLATAAYLAWVLVWLWGQFVSGVYGYHDLTIINDFFSNALVHGRPFWVTNSQETHLRTHFTPSLVLWLPAFAPFKTQFALCAVSAATVSLGIFVTVRDQLASFTRLGLPLFYKFVLGASCFVAFAFNRYTLRVLSSAHFEPFFIFAASVLLAAVSRGARYRWLLAALLFALGVRQDAGFFAFFLLLSCLVAPRAWGEVSRLRVGVAAGVCLVYVVIASMVIMPWFGNDGSTRFWSDWGRTWPEVFMAWLKDPERVIAAIEASEFGAWNAELLYVPVVNVFAWAANQAPAILFYTANSPDKQHLWFYNAAFTLPGLMLCFCFAQLHVLGWIPRITAGNHRWRHFCYVVVSAFCAYVAIDAAVRTPRDYTSETVHSGQTERTDPFAFPPLRKLTRCKNVRSVATDFHTIVYVPFRLDKYLLQNAAKTDLVVVSRDLKKSTPFYIKPKHLVRELTQDGRYVLAGSRNNYEFYLSSQVDCGGGQPLGTGPNSRPM